MLLLNNPLAGIIVFAYWIEMRLYKYACGIIPSLMFSGELLHGLNVKKLIKLINFHSLSTFISNYVTTTQLTTYTCNIRSSLGL